MRKLFFVLVSLLLVVGCIGCGDKPSDLSTLEKIHLRLSKLESYVATADVVKFSNKGENRYRTTQYYKMSGEYRIEFKEPKIVAGNVIIFNGNRIKQINPRVDGSFSLEISQSTERDEMLFGSFVVNYLRALGDSALSSSDLSASGKETVLEVAIPGDSLYMSTEKLWIDNDSLDPIKLVIYDKNGNERAVITYKEFDYNVNIDESLFSLE